MSTTLTFTTRVFDAYGASVTGTAHVQASKNNQDAWTIANASTLPFVGVVTDGVSEGRFSEVGAHVGKRVVADSLLRALALQLDPRTDAFWSSVQRRALRRLATTARSFGGELDHAVCDYLSFTTSGVLVLRDTTHFFSFGDGVRVINGEVTKLGPFERNEPPCLAYGLIDERFAAMPFERTEVATAALQHFIVASDGAGRFIDHPGLRRKGLISTLWENDLFFREPAVAATWLSALNKEPERYRPGDHERFGYFDDDTTLVVARRVGTNSTTNDEGGACETPDLL